MKNNGYLVSIIVTYKVIETDIFCRSQATVRDERVESSCLHPTVDGNNNGDEPLLFAKQHLWLTNSCSAPPWRTRRRDVKNTSNNFDLFMLKKSFCVATQFIW